MSPGSPGTDGIRNICSVDRKVVGGFVRVGVKNGKPERRRRSQMGIYRHRRPRHAKGARLMMQDNSAGTPPHAGPPQGRPEKEFITIRELAAWLGIGRGTAWSVVVEKGEIPHMRISDRVVRIARADVEEYIRRCRSDAAP